MKLGVFTVLFGDRPLSAALDTIKQAGLDAVEIGTGGHPGTAHCDAVALARDEGGRKDFAKLIESRGLTISALSCHGNPLHPNAEIAARDNHVFEQTVVLASEIGVDTVITFAGCPGESEHSLNPVWVTCPWPPEHEQVLAWQWREKVVPYWQRASEFARAHGVRIAIEAHPGFVVYNTETMLHLRTACGDNIGCNFDPSHLFWQGMDPIACIRTLGEARALYHVHAKDTAFDSYNMAQNGVLDTKSYRDERNRSWIFRTVGYGHGEETWRQIVSALAVAGYDGTISIEHEDSLMSVDEGFAKGAALLRSILIREPAANVWWA
ncbi:MAG: sugar phosphate isomerase/epimerase [Firmicutes bacterium]|nr:sugar phosphate isomerase/epimerase [Bacillota bacterium]